LHEARHNEQDRREDHYRTVGWKMIDENRRDTTEATSGEGSQCADYRATVE